jgi:type I restriction enzyme R subunit
MQSVSGPTRTKIVKPHSFVLDLVGISDKLEKALAFDRDEINAIVKTWNF